MAFMTNAFNEADNWVTSNVPATYNIISACGTNRIYGGLGAFGANAASTRLLTGLTPHYGIRIRF